MLTTIHLQFLSQIFKIYKCDIFFQFWSIFLVCMCIIVDARDYSEQ